MIYYIKKKTTHNNISYYVVDRPLLRIHEFLWYDISTTINPRISVC